MEGPLMWIAVVDEDEPKLDIQNREASNQKGMKCTRGDFVLIFVNTDRVDSKNAANLSLLLTETTR
jgi:hypothetical protein